MSLHVDVFVRNVRVQRQRQAATIASHLLGRPVQAGQGSLRGIDKRGRVSKIVFRVSCSQLATLVVEPCPTHKSDHIADSSLQLITNPTVTEEILEQFLGIPTRLYVPFIVHRET